MTEQLKFVESQKGKKMLLYQHYRYRFDYDLATNGGKSWCCVNCNTGCKGRITTLGDSVLSANTSHNHAEEPAENELTKYAHAFEKELQKHWNQF